MTECAVYRKKEYITMEKDDIIGRLFTLSRNQKVFDEEREEHLSRFRRGPWETRPFMPRSDGSGRDIAPTDSEINHRFKDALDLYPRGSILLLLRPILYRMVNQGDDGYDEEYFKSGHPYQAQLCRYYESIHYLVSRNPAKGYHEDETVVIEMLVDFFGEEYAQFLVDGPDALPAEAEYWEDVFGVSNLSVKRIGMATFERGPILLNSEDMEAARKLLHLVDGTVTERPLVPKISDPEYDVVPLPGDELASAVNQFASSIRRDLPEFDAKRTLVSMRWFFEHIASGRGFPSMGKLGTSMYANVVGRQYARLLNEWHDTHYLPNESDRQLAFYIASLFNSELDGLYNTESERIMAKLEAEREKAEERARKIEEQIQREKEKAELQAKLREQQKIEEERQAKLKEEEEKRMREWWERLKRGESVDTSQFTRPQREFLQALEVVEQALSEIEEADIEIESLDREIRQLEPEAFPEPTEGDVLVRSETATMLDTVTTLLSRYSDRDINMFLQVLRIVAVTMRVPDASYLARISGLDDPEAAVQMIVDMANTVAGEGLAVCLATNLGESIDRKGDCASVCVKVGRDLAGLYSAQAERRDDVEDAIKEMTPSTPLESSELPAELISMLMQVQLDWAESLGNPDATGNEFSDYVSVARYVLGKAIQTTYDDEFKSILTSQLARVDQLAKTNPSDRFSSQWLDDNTIVVPDSQDVRDQVEAMNALLPHPMAIFWNAADYVRVALDIAKFGANVVLDLEQPIGTCGGRHYKRRHYSRTHVGSKSRVDPSLWNPSLWKEMETGLSVETRVPSTTDAVRSVTSPSETVNNASLCVGCKDNTELTCASCGVALCGERCASFVDNHRENCACI